MLDAQPNVAAIEAEVLAFWQDQQIYQQSETSRLGQTPFVIFDGPPTANAKPALHHMIPGAFKDLMGRYQTMRGHYVRRQAGWDTHGLPVEVQVERKLGLAGKKDVLNLVPGDEAASIRMFNKICRDDVWEFKQDWEHFLAREGYWINTEQPYITYEPTYVEAVWATFRRVWDKELVYKGYKVVPYCPRCGTSLSASELALEYQDIRDVSVFVNFPLVEKPERSLIAWTTTPWTLPGNTALAINPELTYVVIKQAEKEYILAKDRLSIVVGEYELLEEVPGTTLLGKRYDPPFSNVLTEPGEKHLVISASYVTSSDGSGIVHTAPMYGEDDFNSGQQNHLVMQHTVGLDGHFFDHLPVVGGQYIRDALGTILTHLTESGRLYAKQGFTHSYPHCWRCKTALLYYAKDSWFIAMSSLREQLMISNADVRWIPSHLKEGRFGGFIAEARDWAISRERFWGTPLPIWKSESGQYLCIGSFEELLSLAEDPSLVGTEFDPHRPQVDEIVLVKDGARYTREPLVMDVWFDSGAMPYASGRETAGEFPASFVAEAVDQTRGWFYTLMALGTILKDQSAFSSVVCMGHLMDEQGKKMSKSLGNGLDPLVMMDEVGADALRWFFYTVNAPGETKSFNLADVKTGYRKTLLLTYNLVKYWLTYAPIAKPGGELELLDTWAKERQDETITRVTDSLEAGDFLRAGRLLEEYINDLSTWYLRRSRKRTDQVFFVAFKDRLICLLTLLAPFVPFMTEYLYHEMRVADDSASIHLLDWPKTDTTSLQTVPHMAKLRQLVELGLSLRVEAKVKVRQPLNAAYVEMRDALTAAEVEILADELNVLKVIQTSIPEGLTTRSLEGILIALDFTLTDQLRAEGQARELTRTLQNIRKEAGLSPGQPAVLLAGPFARSILEPSFLAFPAVLTDTSIRVDPLQTWTVPGQSPVEVNGETIFLTLRTD